MSAPLTILPPLPTPTSAQTAATTFAPTPTMSAAPTTQNAVSAPAGATETAVPMALDTHAQPSAASSAAAAVPTGEQQANKTVTDVVSSSSLTAQSDPLAVIAAYRAELETARANLNATSREYAELKKREAERVQAETAAREAAATAAAQAKKVEIDDRKLKLEAALQTALEQVKHRDPNAMRDEDIVFLTSQFRDELNGAGLDEAQIERVANKANNVAQIAIRASASAAARNEEIRARELAEHIEALKQPRAQPFTISGGFMPQMAPTTPAPTMFGGQSMPPPQQQPQQWSQQYQQAAPPYQQASSSSSAYAQPAAAAQTVESGTYNASNNSIFGAVLGKRGASAIDGGNKRTVVSEAVSLPPQQQQSAPPAAQIDFKSPDWMVQVIHDSVQSGYGIPSEDLLRRGGGQVVTKHVASANGNMVAHKEMVPRRQEAFDGEISMKQLHPRAFAYAVEEIAKAIHSGSRPQARMLQEMVEAPHPDKMQRVTGPLPSDGFQRIGLPQRNY